VTGELPEFTCDYECAGRVDDTDCPAHGRADEPVARYVWADDPERHLADWANHPGHAVDYVKVTDVLKDGTHDEWWLCTATEHGHVVCRGRGDRLDGAAYDCLTQLAFHALEQARAQQQTPDVRRLPRPQTARRARPRPRRRPDAIHPSLFPFQRDITRWALRKGQAAVFADTGLGKTRIQIEWARLTGERALILAPLAVAHQTVREAAAIGVDVRYVRNQAEADEATGIVDPTTSGSTSSTRHGSGGRPRRVVDPQVVLRDHQEGARQIVRHTPYRLACTATPAPNDLEELCNHADFLGVMSPSEMRSTFFIADSAASSCATASSATPTTPSSVARLMGDGRQAALRPRLRRRPVPAARP
jgi:hypothetical protein